MTIQPHEISDTLRRMLTKAGRQDLIDNGFDIHDDAVERSRHLFRGGSPDHAMYHALFDRSAPHAEVIRPTPADPSGPLAPAPDTQAAQVATERWEYEAIRHANAMRREMERDADASKRFRLSMTVRILHVVALLAILLTLFAGRAHAQGTVAPVTTAATGASAATSFLSSAASTNATSVKASPGNVYSIRVINTTATLYYLRLYNLATAPTCSSATGFVETIPIPASATGAGLAITQYPQGYTTGIAYCLTGGGGSTDNSNAATGVFVTVLYR